MAASLLLVASCATETDPTSMPASKSGAVSDITVRVEPMTFAAHALAMPPLAKVEVSDIRQRVHSERTTIGGVSMGRIVFKPDELEIVRALVQAKADEALLRRKPRSVPTIHVGVREFGVLTPATALYWDVTAKVDLVLRVGTQDRMVSVAKTERTYWWPSGKLVQGVTNEALRLLAAEAEKAIAELLSGE
jgi:hypothetical protein